MLPQIIARSIEILKPVMPFIRWAAAILGILVKIYEMIRWYAEKAAVKKADIVPEIYKELGEIYGITRKYRYRQTKIGKMLVQRDMKQISRISSEICGKVKNLTGKSLLDVIKDPPQEFPILPSDEMLNEFPILKLIIKEEMRSIGNVTLRTLRLIEKCSKLT